MLNLDKTKKYLLACSYGPDSMALFRMLLDEGFIFEVAHVNYNLRQESKEETENLTGFCDKNSIILHIFENNDDLGANNLEEKCRDIRYAFFSSLSKGFDALLVAHNEDDLIETYLLQKKRNGIVEHFGLNNETTIKGMKVIRPLLEYSKQSLLDFCNQTKTPYAIDKSNLTDQFERNKIRHSIVEKMSLKDRKEIVSEIDNLNKKIKLSREKLLQKPLQKADILLNLDDQDLAYSIHYLAKNIKNDFEISMRQVKEIKKVLESPKPNIKVSIDGLVFTKEYGNISIQQDALSPSYSYLIEKPCILDTPYFYLDFTKGSEDRNVNLDDYPITIRNALSTDVLKIKNYSKSVRRLFIDWKVPMSKRATWPVIVNNKGDVVYIPRYRSDFIITSNLNFYVK